MTRRTYQDFEIPQKYAITVPDIAFIWKRKRRRSCSFRWRKITIHTRLSLFKKLSTSLSNYQWP